MSSPPCLPLLPLFMPGSARHLSLFQVHEYEEELEAALRQTQEHMALTSLEHRLVAEAAALKSHLEAIVWEGSRLENFAANVQVRRPLI